MRKHELEGIGGISLFLILCVLTNSAPAMSLEQTITAIGNRLESEQVGQGLQKGSWPEEEWFTGIIVAGMVDAFDVMGQDDYKESAELGGNYILLQAQGNLYDNEALALARLSAIAKNPNDNIWRSEVSDFYAMIKNDVEGGTNGYISLYAELDPSTAVTYLANHVIAADYVNAKDRKVWRQGLISWLSHVDDSCVFPVMALGSATWALARTGPLDETMVDPFGNGAAYWNMKKLSDLPELLLSHQVPDGQAGAGEFYWRFDHSNGGSTDLQSSGYTEDAIYATLGLIASVVGSADTKTAEQVSAIASARDVLVNSVNSDGSVSELLSQEGANYYIYAGEMLTVLRELQFYFEGQLPGEAVAVDYVPLLWERTARAGISISR